jgi:hypothetical protein
MREISAFVSPTFLSAIMLLPDDARYAVYSLFVTLHGKYVAAVYEVDSALEDSILNVRCACIMEAFTRYREAYALSMNIGQQSDVCWPLDNALLVCIRSALVHFGCERVTGPIIADMPHQSDPQHISKLSELISSTILEQTRKCLRKQLFNSVCSFLGFMQHFGHFILRSGDLASILYDQTKDNAPPWTEACTTARNSLRTCLQRATLKHHPDYNCRFMYILTPLIVALGVFRCKNEIRLCTPLHTVHASLHQLKSIILPQSKNSLLWCIASGLGVVILRVLPSLCIQITSLLFGSPVKSI